MSIKYKFMQLGGNCACIGYLGDDRVRGPVDNVITNGALCLKLLFEHKYLEYIKTSKPKIETRTPGWNGDSKYFYKYDAVWIVHHNPQTEHYYKNLEKRLNTFYNFLEQVKTNDNYYFTINLNELDLEKSSHKLKNTVLENTLKFLKQQNILNKVIFISTKTINKNITWNYWSDEADLLFNKYNAKHINIIDNNIWETEASHKQFEDKVLRLLENTYDNTIDLVLPYVDSTDKNWQEVFNKYNPAKESSEAINAKNRFRGQGDFFRYFFRSVAKNMPWINNIFLLVMSESQVPKWLDRTKVKVITHDQFIPQQFLPTFNSGTIEMFLQNIPGLSEKFIYANDDMYILNKLNISNFFNNQECTINLVKDSLEPSKINMWRQMCQNNYDTIFGTTKALPYLRCDHEFRPYLKSKMLECFNKYKQEIYKSITQFRSEKNLTIYLFNLYMYKNKYTMPMLLNCGYLSSTSNNFEIVRQLKKDTICLNDTSDTIDIYNNIKINNYFYKLFPQKCKYELFETNSFKLMPEPVQKAKPAKSAVTYWGNEDTYF